MGRRIGRLRLLIQPWIPRVKPIHGPFEILFRLLGQVRLQKVNDRVVYFDIVARRHVPFPRMLFLQSDPLLGAGVTIENKPRDSVWGDFVFRVMDK